MARFGSWDRKIWEDLSNLLRTDSEGNTSIKVSFENDSTDDEIDPGELQRMHLQVSLKILEQLQIMNMQLSLITDEEIKGNDIEP